MKQIPVIVLLTMSLVGCGGRPGTESTTAPPRVLEWNIATNASSNGDLLQARCSHFDVPDSSATANDLMYATACEAYILGAADAYESVFAQMNGGGRWLCQSPKIPDVVSAVRKYMSVHPEALHMGAEVIVHNALAVAFTKGCKSTEPK